MEDKSATNDVEASVLEQHAPAADDGGLDYKEWNGVDIISSLCMRCGATGETRLMLHKIPHFRELVIASFHCDECGEHNNEVTFGGEIQLQGSIHQLKVTSAADLNRQIIKSDSAAVRIRELELEIPAHTQKGEINTLEGILRTAAKNLSLFQAERLQDDLQVGLKVAMVISSLYEMADGEYLPFHLEVDDPAGNSYLENPYMPSPDPHLVGYHYYRTREQDASLGLDPDKGVYKDDSESNYLSLLQRTRARSPDHDPEGHEHEQGLEANDDNSQLGRSEAVSIPSPCPHCGLLGASLTAVTDIPHFKEVIIMSFTCKICGFKSTDVKAGGAVPLHGTEVRLRVTGPEDLKRDLLKSDSASVCIPELELELGTGSLGGLFTTVEGLLSKILSTLRDQNPFMLGDSATLHHSAAPELPQGKQRFAAFLGRLEACSKGEAAALPFSIHLRDPLGNSFISAPLGTSLPPELDSNLTLVDYTRSFEEDEEFGLNDMNTAAYEVVPAGSGNGGMTMAQLPDRLAHPHHMGADHPTFFAKGCADGLAAGAYLGAGAAAAATPEVVVEEEAYFCPPPAGWGAERAPEEVNGHHIAAAATPSEVEELPMKRIFTDDSADSAFLARESFYGTRPGMVFRMGSQGLGYYTDRGPMVLPVPLPSAAAVGEEGV